MKHGNILDKLLERLIDSSDDREASTVDSWGSDKKKPKIGDLASDKMRNESRTDLNDPEDNEADGAECEDDEEDMDDSGMKQKKFLDALKSLKG